MHLDTSKSLLVLISRNNSEESWRIFVAVYRPFILKCIASRHVPLSDAEDLCQESLTQVFKAIAGFHHNGRPGAFRNWLRTIVSQKVWNYFQRENRLRRAKDAARDSALSTADSTDAELNRLWDREHDRHVVEKMLEMIKREFSVSSWQAFRLVVLQGTAPARAAEQLGISTNAVLLAKSRVMRRLKGLGDGLVSTIELKRSNGVGQ